MPPKGVDNFLKSCIERGLLIDTCCLLILCFGTSHKRTHGMDNEQMILDRIVKFTTERGSRIILTPHIVAEASNIVLNRKKPSHAQDVGDIFNSLVNAIKSMHEHHIPKDKVINSGYISFLGFTDISIMSAAQKRGYGVVTVDSELFSRLCEVGCNVVHPTTIDITNLASM